jgi:hypothetical protein
MQSVVVSLEDLFILQRYYVVDEYMLKWFMFILIIK